MHEPANEYKFHIFFFTIFFFFFSFFFRSRTVQFATSDRAQVLRYASPVQDSICEIGSGIFLARFELVFWTLNEESMHWSSLLQAIRFSQLISTGPVLAFIFESSRPLVPAIADVCISADRIKPRRKAAVASTSSCGILSDFWLIGSRTLQLWDERLRRTRLTHVVVGHDQHLVARSHVTVGGSESTGSTFPSTLGSQVGQYQQG